jgi:hypothetical protein
VNREIIEVTVGKPDGATGVDLYRTVTPVLWTENRPRLYRMRYWLSDRLEDLASWIRPPYWRRWPPSARAAGTYFYSVKAMEEPSDA